MKPPKFTDLHRYPRGYKHATDVAATFKRVQREMADAEKQREADRVEAASKTVPIRRAKS